MDFTIKILFQENKRSPFKLHGKGSQASTSAMGEWSGRSDLRGINGFYREL